MKMNDNEGIIIPCNSPRRIILAAGEAAAAAKLRRV